MSGGRVAMAALPPLTAALLFLWHFTNDLNDVLIAYSLPLFGLGGFAVDAENSTFCLDYLCLAIPAPLFIRRRVYCAAILANGARSSGVLAVRSESDRYNYVTAPAEVFDLEHAVAFSPRHSALARVIRGMVEGGQVAANLADARCVIPPALWDTCHEAVTA